MKQPATNQGVISLNAHSIPDQISIPKMLVEKPFNIIRQFQHGFNTDLNTF